jgi:GNAT superfamily N-acetyltransferase
LPNTVTIRVATKGDVETIHKLVLALGETLGYSDEVKGSVEELRAFGFGSHAFYKALIAEKAGEPVGLCIYYMTFSSWRGTPGVCVLDLYVDEKMRGAGVGRRLMAEVALAGQSVGASFLHLAVHHSNEIGKAFYQGMGMTPADMEQVYQLEGDRLDALISDVEEK